MKIPLHATVLVSAFAFTLAGCQGGGGDKTVEDVPIPTDFALNLFCESEGINNNTCVLEDPENPYARSIVNNDNKFELFNSSPSAKSDFYIWATALARAPIGENQYYTALALHDLYTQGGSEVAREQAKKAYRSLLDNFFDSQTFFPGSPQLDYIPDRDFFYSDFGAGSAGAGWDGGFTEDADFSPVWSVPAGTGYGANFPTASLAFQALALNDPNVGLPAGFAANYDNIEFKVKDLPTANVFLTFAGGGANQELSFDIATFGSAIPDTTGWTQVSIPLSSFANRNLYTDFSISAGFGNGGTMLLTDIGFTGDATGNGLVNDVDDNGGVFLYRSGTQLFALDLKDLAGRNLYDPVPSNLLQLYQNQQEAVDAMASWGYQYDPVTEELTAIP